MGGGERIRDAHPYYAIQRKLSQVNGHNAVLRLISAFFFFFFHQENMPL